jgi:hypothetical protein
MYKPWIIEQYIDHGEWDDWYPLEEPGTGNMMTFRNRDDAQAYLDQYLEDMYQQAMSDWKKNLLDTKEARKLFQRRKDALYDAGLWDDKNCPLVPVKVLPKPVKSSGWRIRLS